LVNVDVMPPKDDVWTGHMVQVHRGTVYRRERGLIGASRTVERRAVVKLRRQVWRQNP
jgi:hypothetical protein